MPGFFLVAASAAELAALRLMATLAGRFGAQTTSTTSLPTSMVAQLVGRPRSGSGMPTHA